MRRSIIVLMAALAATPAYASDVDAMLRESARRNVVSVTTVLAVAEVESGKRCGARNGSSRGIMQVQRQTAKEVGISWPFQNCKSEIEAGVRYLKLAIAKGGDSCSGYTLYNIGINAWPHCSAYGRKIVNEKRKIK